MTNFGSAGHFGLIFGLGVTNDQFWLEGSLWDHSGIGINFGPFRVCGSFMTNFESLVHYGSILGLWGLL